ncbi:hypothetical protein Tco_1260683 [Tanacetum coccineum]
MDVKGSSLKSLDQSSKLLSAQIRVVVCKTATFDTPEEALLLGAHMPQMPYQLSANRVSNSKAKGKRPSQKNISIGGGHTASKAGTILFVGWDSLFESDVMLLKDKSV